MGFRLKISCALCGYFGHVIRDAEVYCLPDGTRAVADVQPAWCRNCDAASLAERIPLEQEVLAAIAKLNRNEPFPDSQEMRLLLEHHGSEADLRRSMIRSSEQQLAWLRLRRSPGRCILCGSHDYTLFRRVDFGQPALQHPECEGSLSVSFVAHVSMGLSPGLTVEGLRIRGA